MPYIEPLNRVQKISFLLFLLGGLAAGGMFYLRGGPLQLMPVAILLTLATELVLLMLMLDAAQRWTRRKRIPPKKGGDP